MKRPEAATLGNRVLEQSQKAVWRMHTPSALTLRSIREAEKRRPDVRNATDRTVSRHLRPAPSCTGQ